MANSFKSKKLIIVISSPSGAGKSSICKRLLYDDPQLNISISDTTRSPRDNETNGTDYNFIEKNEFERRIKNNEYIEYANVFGNYYGSLEKDITAALENGFDVLFDIDWQGADQIKNKGLDYKLITFFILPPSKEVLLESLSNRHMRDKLIVEERIKQFSRDVLHWINYDYVVINEDLNKCYSKIINLINAEINNGSKDYDIEYIRTHVEKLTS